MKERNRFITGKVVVGYLLLIAIAVYAVSYIYNIVEQVAVEEHPDLQAAAPEADCPGGASFRHPLRTKGAPDHP